MSQYSVVLVLSDIFIGCDAHYQCWSDSSWRCPQDNHLEVSGAVGVTRWLQRDWEGASYAVLARMIDTILRVKQQS